MTSTRERKPLPELQAENIPVCTAVLAGVKINPQSDTDDEAKAEAARILSVLDDYFRIFAAPKSSGIEPNFGFGGTVCICCGATLGGAFGSFAWGLCHGEGTCECGYPCRGLHYPKDTDGESLFTRGVPVVLQYHPSELSENRRDDSEG